MKMAEPPSEAVAEEPNQEDLVSEKTQDVMVAEMTDNSTHVDNSEAEVPNGGEIVNPQENVTVDGENNGDKETNLSQKEGNKPENNGEPSSVFEQHHPEDSAQNGVNSEDTPVTVKERPEELQEVSNIDEGKKEAAFEEIIEPTIVAVDSAVTNEVEKSKDSELVDQSASEQKTDNLDEDTNEDSSRLTKKQLREHYENLQTKYSASELQLESLREQNAELVSRITALEEQLQKVGSKSSSVVDVREKACQRDGLKVQADYLARELSQVQDTEKYLREKVAELLEVKEESERKVKDLQLRLKRFVKDDEAKDERVAKLEMELREVSQEVQQLESYLDEETLQKVRRSRSNTENSGGQNGEVAGAEGKGTATATPPPQSKACVIL